MPMSIIICNIIIEIILMASFRNYVFLMLIMTFAEMLRFEVALVNNFRLTLKQFSLPTLTPKGTAMSFMSVCDYLSDCLATRCVLLLVVWQIIDFWFD